MIARTAERESELIVEKFFEDQAGLRGAAKTVQEFDTFIFRREVREEEGVASRGKFVAFADLGRERIGNVSLEIGEHAVNNFAKHARADGAERFVYRNDATDFGGVSGGTGFGGGY